MKKTNNTKYYIIAGAAVLVAGAAIIFSSGNLFQGKFGPKYCDLYPGGVSEVTSWVPTVLTTYEPPSQGATPVVSQVPCVEFYEAEINKFVHPAEKVGPPVDLQKIERIERVVQPTDEVVSPIEKTVTPRFRR